MSEFRKSTEVINRKRKYPRSDYKLNKKEVNLLRKAGPYILGYTGCWQIHNEIFYKLLIRYEILNKQIQVIFQT